MLTTGETILTALHARLQTLAATALRDEVLPERIPSAFLIILRDNQPGEPEVRLSPLHYHFQHWAELEVIVALLHKSASGRTAPIPGQTYPTTFVTGLPSAV